MGKLEDIIKKVLKIEEVTDETSPKNTGSWDSFNALKLVAKIEEAYDLNFAMSEVVAVKNVSDIRKVISANIQNEHDARI